MLLRLGRYLWPSSGTRIFLVSLVVWTPLLAAGITFALSGFHHFGRSLLVATVISEVVALECYFGARVVAWVERSIRRAAGWPEATHGLGWQLLLAGVLMPFALPVGFAAGGGAARLLGFPGGPVGLESYRVGLLFGALLMLLFFLQRTRSDARDAARAAEARVKDLETARLRAQLAALTAEMNPHLLFNALNTVASLVHKDPDRAEEVVLELSDLYRGVLRSARAAAHPLREEVALCEAYLKIEQARFGERLTTDIEIDEAIDPSAIEVPVLILQPFVENAVKHGISPSARGGRVSLRLARDADRLVAMIEDDGVGLGASSHQGAGRAVANCEERLALTYGETASLRVEGGPGRGTCVTLTLPLEPARSREVS